MCMGSDRVMLPASIAFAMLEFTIGSDCEIDFWMFIFSGQSSAERALSLLGVSSLCIVNSLCAFQVPLRAFLII